MDKRTLLFLICVSITLFLVNLYFDRQHQNDLQVWNEQQKTLKVQKEKALEEEIQSQTANAKDLPLVDLYADSKGTTFFAKGVENEGSVLVIAGDSPLPLRSFKKKKAGKNSFPSSWALIKKSPMAWQFTELNRKARSL